MSLQRFRIPASPFPPPGPAGAPFPGFRGTTKMLRLPAARPSRFVSFAPQVPRDCTVREGAGSCCCRLLVGAYAGASILSLRSRLAGTTGPPKFPGEPHCACALLSDPGGISASGHYDARMLPTSFPNGSAPATKPTFRGSITRLTALTVYASWLGLLRSTPRKTRFRLAASLCRAGI